MLGLFLVIFLLGFAKCDQSTDATIRSLQAQVDRLTQKVDAMETRFSLMPVPEVAVYFSASISAPKDIAADSKVSYETISVNAGDMFDSTGTFLCPVGGYYYFHVSVKSDALRVAQVSITHEAAGVATNMGSAMSAEGLDHASNGVIIDCAAGDTVYVRAGPSGGRMYSEASLPYNTFIGMLLWVSV